MIIHSSLILLFLSTAIAFPLQPVDSALLPDINAVSNPETIVSFNNEPGLVEQTLPPPLGISTSQNPGPPITDSPLDIIQFQPSFFSSNFDMGGSSFELAQNSPTVKKGAPAAASTVETVYRCCELKGEDRYLCNDCER